MKLTNLAVLLCLCLAPGAVAADAPATSPARRVEVATHARLGLTALAAEVDLPSGGWEIVAVVPPGALEQPFLTAPARSASVSRRVRAAEIERRVESGNRHVRRLYGSLQQYAAEHGGIGPGSSADLELLRENRLHAAALRAIETSPWEEDRGADLQGPFFHIMPDVHLLPAGPDRPPPGAPPVPLALELRPYRDDGRHWVLMSDGTTERRTIDRELLRSEGVAVAPVMSGGAEATAPPPGPVPASLFAIVRDAAAERAVVTLRARTGGGTLAFGLPLREAARGDEAIVARWAAARAASWKPLLAGGGAVLQSWALSTPEIYGAEGRSPGPRRPAGIRDEARSTDALGVLGGRAALRGTLQLQALAAAGPAGDAAATIPVSTLAGVDVPAHPFDELLAGRAGGHLPLATRVPADRLFVWFGKPGTLFPLLEGGADFLARGGGLVTGTAFDDALVERHLRRLGLGGGLGRRLLASDEVVELALTAPDLFFLDGTDLTVIARLRRPERAVPLLRELAAVDLTRGGVVAKPLPSGRSAFWARQGDLLLVGSNLAEVEAVLALGEAGGTGSLGESAEFRAMLLELTPGSGTRAFAYLSDPFIRRLVGPEVKIGQLRRLRARAEMERILAAALLARLDGQGSAGGVERLERLGYLPRGFAASGYRIDADLLVRSPEWGSAAEMETVGARPVESVTAAEAEAYARYVGEYRRFWRQFFDPVALRLEEVPGGGLELETFVLPLLESPVYGALRSAVASHEEGPPLLLPELTPEPVLTLSLVLGEGAWTRIAGKGELAAAGGLDPALLDLLGPGVHFAVQDADPVLALGTGDLLGAFAGRQFTRSLSRSGLLPLALSALTRPCRLLVELTDGPAALAAIRDAAARPVERGPGEVSAVRRQVDGRDAWVWTIDLLGLARLRFGVEVRDGYLVVGNLPWSGPLAIGGREDRGSGGAALRLAPGAVRKGLPGLFATAGEEGQRAALAGMAALYPLLAAGSSSVAAAAEAHATVLGSRPVHPGPGEFRWEDGELSSTTYGTARRWRVPPWDAAAGDFGLFAGIERLSATARIEENGLRARLRWHPSGAGR